MPTIIKHYPTFFNGQQSKEPVEIVLSKETDAALNELRKLQKTMADYQSDCDKLLANDASDLEKVVAKLGSVRAGIEMLKLRISRLQGRLFDLLKKDVLAACDGIEQAEKDAYAAYKKGKEGWDNELAVRFKGDAAGRIKFKDPLWYPQDLRKIYNGWREAQSMSSAVEFVRRYINPPNQEGLAIVRQYNPYMYAAEMLPELSGCGAVMPTGTIIENIA